VNRSILMVFVLVCMLGSCIPAFAVTPNSVIISTTSSGTGTGLSKSIIINATATYQTSTSLSSPWTSITSTATVTIFYTVKNSTGGVIQNGSVVMAANMVPNLSSLQYNGPTGRGQKHKRGSPFSVALSITSTPGAASFTWFAKVDIQATWHRSSGSPSTDVHNITFKTPIY
jgi:hypothetical protein